MNRKLLTIALMAALLLLAGCTAQANPQANTPTADGSVAGFWLGLWHGVILPIAFLISLFNPAKGVYELHNNGAWYNAGFVLGTGFFPLLRPITARNMNARRQQDPPGTNADAPKKTAAKNPPPKA